MKNFCVFVGGIVGYYSSVAYRENIFEAANDPSIGAAVGVMWFLVYMPIGIVLGIAVGLLLGLLLDAVINRLS